MPASDSSHNKKSKSLISTHCPAPSPSPLALTLHVFSLHVVTGQRLVIDCYVCVCVCVSR